MQKNTFYEVRCHITKNNGKTCNHYLGDIQVDVENTARFYCRNCNKAFEYTAKTGGLIMRKVVKREDKFEYLEKPVIIG